MVISQVGMAEGRSPLAQAPTAHPTCWTGHWGHSSSVPPGLQGSVGWKTLEKSLIMFLPLPLCFLCLCNFSEV